LEKVVVMIYIVNCKLRTGFDEYQKALVNAIYEKFGLEITKEEKLPAHFTLKYWFETENIRKIESVFEKFARTHKKTPVSVGRVNSFPPKVIFIDVRLSDDAKKVFFELINELRKIPWMPWDKYDAENLHFHSTIAEECNEKYGAVMKFIQSKELQQFDCWFDNITIMKNVGGTKYFGKWEVYKTFEFQQ
jgi:2'-5' RNA ligase